MNKDWFERRCLSWIITAYAAAVCVSCQELTSTLRQGNRTCPGEEIIFNCTVRGSQTLTSLTLAWSSVEYIGQDNLLQFTILDMPGLNKSSVINGNVTATVTNNTSINGVPTLVSELRITADQASNVTCTVPGGGAASKEFYVTAVPGVPQRISAAEISRLSDNICIILVTWDPPANSDASDIDQYIVYVPSRNIRDDILSSTTSVLTVPNCRDGDIRIQVAAVNLFGCVGPNFEVQPSLLDIPVPPTVPVSTVSATTENGTTSTTEIGSASTSNSVVPVLAAVLAVTFLLFLISVLTTSTLLFFFYKGRNRSAVKYQTDEAGGGEPKVMILDIPGTAEEKRKEYNQMAEEEEDAKQIIQENLKKVYEALKVNDRNLLQKAVKQLSENLKKPYASGRIVIKALKNTVKTIRRKDGEEFRRALDTLKDSVDISSVSGGMEDIVKMLHTTVGTDDHEEAIAELKNVLMVWANSVEIKECLQKLCDKLLEDESQLNTTVESFIEDGEAS